MFLHVVIKAAREGDREKMLSGRRDGEVCAQKEETNE